MCGAMTAYPSLPITSCTVRPRIESSSQPHMFAYALLAKRQRSSRASKYAISTGTLSASMRISASFATALSSAVRWSVMSSHVPR